MNKVYFNGKFIDEDKAVVPINTHALHYGTGVFEGIRAYYNDQEDALFVFRLEDHYQRIAQSCKILFITLPHSTEELCQKTIELLQKNFQKTDIYIRPLAYKSDPAVGNFNLHTLKDGFLIYTTPLGRYSEKEAVGIKAGVSSWRRVADNMIPPRGKITGAYANTSLAKTEATLAGYDEALFLDQDGHVVEGSAENLFIVKNGTVFTPPASSDILQGITRETAMELLKKEMSLEVVERSIDRSEIYQIDELFLVGTGAEVLSVIEVDGRKIGNGEVGETTKKIKDIYNQIVRGQNPKYAHWTTKVSNTIL